MNDWQMDPEFTERFEHFAFSEVPNEQGQQLDEQTRHMAILAALLGCQGVDEFKRALNRALDAGVSPVMAKEIVYQAVDYLGIGRVRPFLDAANGVLLERGVCLPLEPQATTTLENRLQKGIQAQVDIFGEHMRTAWQKGHINRWLDVYKRQAITTVPSAAAEGASPRFPPRKRISPRMSSPLPRTATCSSLPQRARCI